MKWENREFPSGGHDWDYYPGALYLNSLNQVTAQGKISTTHEFQSWDMKENSNISLCYVSVNKFSMRIVKLYNLQT